MSQNEADTASPNAKEPSRSNDAGNMIQGAALADRITDTAIVTRQGAQADDRSSEQKKESADGRETVVDAGGVVPVTDATAAPVIYTGPTAERIAEVQAAMARETAEAHRRFVSPF